MAYPKELRNQLGISLQAFSTLIECNQSQLSMAESGSRSLPASSSIFLAALAMAHAQIENSTQVAQPNSEETVAWLNKHVRSCAATKVLQLMEMEKLVEKNEETNRFLQLAALLDGNPSFAESKYAGLQLEILTRKATTKQKEYQLQLVKLQLSIAGLEAEIARAAMLL